MSWSPSPTAVSRPSRVRTSSPPRYTFTNGASSPSVEELRGKRRIALDEIVDDLGDGRALRLELARTSDLGAKRRRDADGGHQTSTGALQNST